jgi:tetratricopeptide (TPR) repeat protein
MNQPLNLLSVTISSKAAGVNGTVAPTRPSATVAYSVRNTLSTLSARFQAAQTVHQQGQLATAQAIYEEILSVQPDHFGALHFLGVVAAQTEQFERAVELIGRSLQIQGNVAAAFNNYGNAFKGLRNYEAALENYDKAIALDGNYADAYFNRGVTLVALNQLDEGILSYDQAIATRPDYSEAHYDKSLALGHMDRLEAALSSYESAIAIEPQYAEAHLDRGVTLVALNQLDAAILSYDRVIAIRPDYAEAHYFKSLALLKKGDFNDGWVEHEWRWATERLPSFREKRSFAEPLWLGKESIKGKTILICGEQGLGDMIQFCRYVELVAGLGAEVILEVPKPLSHLLAGLKGVSRIVEKGTPLPRFDFYSPLMSLPLAFKTDLSHIPSSTAYLAADRTKIARWLAKLGPATKPRVGLVWSGSRIYSNDQKRSIALAELITHLPRDFQYISLQKDIRETDREALKHVLDFSSDLHDFSDTAALCACMDLVISVDTSVAHLCGALGIPAWVMVAFAPDWRWLLAREDSPWYGSVKIFRQESRGDWTGVMQRVAADLARICQSTPVWHT